jgi:hypothetical protein
MMECGRMGASDTTWRGVNPRERRRKARVKKRGEKKRTSSRVRMLDDNSVAIPA